MFVYCIDGGLSAPKEMTTSLDALYRELSSQVNFTFPNYKILDAGDCNDPFLNRDDSFMQIPFGDGRVLVTDQCHGNNAKRNIVVFSRNNIYALRVYMDYPEFDSLCRRYGVTEKPHLIRIIDSDYFGVLDEYGVLICLNEQSFNEFNKEIINIDQDPVTYNEQVGKFLAEEFMIKVNTMDSKNVIDPCLLDFLYYLSQYPSEYDVWKREQLLQYLLVEFYKDNYSGNLGQLDIAGNIVFRTDNGYFDINWVCSDLNEYIAFNSFNFQEVLDIVEDIERF